jgi:hypothetical protein
MREEIATVLEHADFRHVSLFRAVADERAFCLNLLEET